MMKRCIGLLMIICLLFSIMPAAATDTPDLPTFSDDGGFYSDEFYLSFLTKNDELIYYTTDGSEPTINSNLYTDPILIQKREVLGNDTSPMTSKANARGANAKVFLNATVIKAKAFSLDKTKSSKSVTNTYFVTDNISDVFKMPVVSISIEPDDFAGDKNGFYTNPMNEDLTPQCFVEYFEKDGTPGFKHSAEIKISGHYSRTARKKSLRLNFTKGKYENDKKLLSYNLFPESQKNYINYDKVTEHAKVTARISDWDRSTIRESLTEKIADPLRTETMTTVSTAIFINGEFWGVYELREQFDNNFVAQRYEGIKKGDVVQLDVDWDTNNTQYPNSHPLYRVSYSEGPDGEEEKYFNEFMSFYDLITGGEIHKEEVYEELKKKVDIDNFIDYLSVYMFFDNVDWPGNNIKMWRTANDLDESAPYGKDGRWRFIIHDFDIAYENYSNNTLSYYTTSPSLTDSRRPTWATKMISDIFKNEEFRNKFAARYFTYLNTTFNPQRTLPLLNSLVSRLEGGIGADFYRWNLHGGKLDSSVSNWKNSSSNGIKNLQNYLTGRISKSKEHIRSYYNNKFSLDLSDEHAKINYKNEELKGYFSIDGADIMSEKYGSMAEDFSVDYLKGLPVNIKFVPNNERIFDHLVVYDKETDISIIVDDTNYTFNPTGEYDISVVYKDEPIIIESISPTKNEDGTISSKFYVTNNQNEDLPFTLYFALYNEEETLCDIISSGKVTLKNGETEEFSYSLDTNLAGEGYKVKVYMWDDNMSPFINPVDVK